MIEENKHINYSSADIEKYLKGELSPAAMHAMEKAALDDPFLADAIEGFEVRSSKFTADDSSPEVATEITNLKNRLAERIAEEKRTPVVKFSWWKVAAAVIIFIGAGWMYLQVVNKNKPDIPAVAKNVSTDIELKKKEAKSEMPASIDKDSAGAFLHKTDTATLQSIAVIERRKAPSEKFNTLPAKIQYQSSDTFATTAGIGAFPLAKNKETEFNLKTTESKGFYKSYQQPNTPKPSENNSVVARADKREQSFLNDIATTKTPSGRPGQENTFQGMVVDQSNNPLANASVQVPGTGFATTTDNKGNFSVRSQDSTVNVSVTSLGYESQKQNLQNNVALNQVRLKPAQNNLNEVVVTGYGAKRKQSSDAKDLSVKIQDAEPVISLDEYDAWLEKNKRISDEAKNIHGNVIVSFTVRINGLSRFKIEQSINNDALDQEAIRLIKEGPAWKLLKGKKASVTYMVKF